MFFNKGFSLKFVSMAVALGYLTSCASGGVRPPMGRPGSRSSADESEVVRANPQKSIGQAWNRWSEESENKIVINSGEVISNRYLPRVLELSSDPGVVASMDQYRKWTGWAQISAMVLAASLVSTGIGYIRTTDGSTTLPIPMINILWGVSGLAIGATTLSLLKQESYLQEALSRHNQQIRGIKTGASSWSLAWRFEF